LRRRELFKCGAALAALGVAPALRAQDVTAWPAKPVRLILPFTPGGATDFQGRILCDMLTRHFGQQFFIDYKPGAGSNLGVAEVARSTPDGYTLGWITVASHAINPTLYAKLPFDYLKDFAPVSMTGIFPNLLVVNNQLPVKTVQDLIAPAKKQPGKLTFASSLRLKAMAVPTEQYDSLRRFFERVRSTELTPVVLSRCKWRIARSGPPGICRQ